MNKVLFCAECGQIKSTAIQFRYWNFDLVNSAREELKNSCSDPEFRELYLNSTAILMVAAYLNEGG